MSQRPHFVASSLILVLVLVLLNLPDRAAVGFRLAVGSLFLPLFGLVGSAQGFIEQSTKEFSPRRSLLREIQQLQRENQELRVQALQGSEALRENDRLRQMLNWQKQSRWKLKPARIIARDTAHWWQTFWIDLGSRDNLRPDLPVLAFEGLVGRTMEVGYASSQVVIVGEPNCRVSVMVRETGENGVLSGANSGVLDHRLVDLTHLPRNSTLSPGQRVDTSGLGGVFPAGIPVGTVVDSRPVSFGLYTEARVKLAADTSRLREVMVLIP